MSRNPDDTRTPNDACSSKDHAGARPPEIVPREDWSPVEPPNLEGGRGSFVSGEPGGGRLRVAYFRQPEREGLVGRAWFGPGAEGPPGHAHGGSIGAVLDEAMGSSAWLDGYPVVAAHLEVDFRRMLPLGTDALLEARVDRVAGRKVHCKGRLTDEEGRPFAEGSGLFIVLDPDHLREHLGPVAEALGLEPEELLERMRAAVTRVT